jgi:hypothetical protein
MGNTVRGRMGPAVTLALCNLFWAACMLPAAACMLLPPEGLLLPAMLHG